MKKARNKLLFWSGAAMAAAGLPLAWYARSWGMEATTSTLFDEWHLASWGAVGMWCYIFSVIVGIVGMVHGRKKRPAVCLALAVMLAAGLAYQWFLCARGYAPGYILLILDDLCPMLPLAVMLILYLIGIFRAKELPGSGKTGGQKGENRE